MPAGWRTIRVFISSTFLDMHSERDYLVRFVFPRLREELARHRAHLVDVDLRWGITSGQDALEVCRDIIDECRPRFIALLGERYGWVPPGRRHSITAAEIAYALQNQEELGRHIFFYFRDPAATAGVPEAEARAHGLRETASAEEEAGIGAQAAGQRAAQRRESLSELKQAIVDSGFAPFVYPARWDRRLQRFASLEAFGERVYQDLLESALTELGAAPAQPPDPLAEQNTAMEDFAAQAVSQFVLGSRRPLFDEVVHHVITTGPGCCLYLGGEPGVGKSAFLSYLHTYLTAAEQPGARRLVLPHFVGATLDSTDIEDVLKRLYRTLLAALEEERELPDGYPALRQSFPQVLAQVARQRPVVLILDGVDQLADSHDALSMHWLPTALPDNVRVVLSSADPEVLQVMRGRREPPMELTVPRLTVDDVGVIAEQFLARYGKRLDGYQRAALLGKADANLPLYLITALDELRTLGTYEEISQRIADLPEQLEPLFLWVLQRLEDDPGFQDDSGRPVGPAVVRDFASCLAMSRYGLSPAELAQLVAPGDPRADPPVPADARGHVAALERLLRLHLDYQSELLTLAHPQFRRAVMLRYLPAPVRQRECHARLAGYFGTTKRVDKRKMEELSWQLVGAEDWDGLVALLTNPMFVISVSRWRSPSALEACWREVERHSTHTMLGAYAPVLADPPKMDHYLHALAGLLNAAGHHQEAMVLYDALARGAGASARQYNHLPTIAGEIGQIQITGPNGEPMRSSQEGARAGEALARAQAVGNKALAMTMAGDLEGALVLQKQCERTFRELDDRASLGRCLGNQAIIMRRQGDFEATMALHQEEERAFREAGATKELGTCLFNQAALAAQLGEHSRAAELFQQAGEASGDAGDADGTLRSLRECGKALEEIGDTAGALSAYRRQERICRGLGDVRKLVDCLQRQALLLAYQDQNVEAAVLRAEAKRLLVEGLG